MPPHVLNSKVSNALHNVIQLLHNHRCYLLVTCILWTSLNVYWLFTFCWSFSRFDLQTTTDSLHLSELLKKVMPRDKDLLGGAGKRGNGMVDLAPEFCANSSSSRKDLGWWRRMDAIPTSSFIHLILRKQLTIVAAVLWLTAAHAHQLKMKGTQLSGQPYTHSKQRLTMTMTKKWLGKVKGRQHLENWRRLQPDFLSGLRHPPR